MYVGKLSLVECNSLPSHSLDSDNDDAKAGKSLIDIFPLDTHTHSHSHSLVTMIMHVELIKRKKKPLSPSVELMNDFPLSSSLISQAAIPMCSCKF